MPAGGSDHTTGAAGGNERHAAEPGEPGTLARRPAVHHGIPPCAAFSLPQGVLSYPSVTHRNADSPLALAERANFLWSRANDCSLPPSCRHPGGLGSIQVGNTIEDSKGRVVRQLPVAQKGDEDHLAFLTAETISAGHAVLIFCPTRQSCADTADRIGEKVAVSAGHGEESRVAALEALHALAALKTPGSRGLYAAVQKGTLPCLAIRVRNNGTDLPSLCTHGQRVHRGGMAPRGTGTR